MAAAMPRLLFLHGQHANSQLSEFQAQILQLDTVASCSYLDAPHLTGQKCHEDMDGEGRSWMGPDGDVRPALECVVEHCRAHGPFDGAYGFSQGASVLALLCDAGVLRSVGVDAPLWRFAICVCGVPPRPMQEIAVEQPICLPSYHVHGAADAFRPQSEELLARFERPQLLTHPWGHAVPVALATTHEHLIQPLLDFVRAPGLLRVDPATEEERLDTREHSPQKGRASVASAKSGEGHLLPKAEGVASVADALMGA